MHAIDKAMELADHRLSRWETHLNALEGPRVEVAELESAFPGLTSEGGEFRTHLELALLALALKRRVTVLQGVEAGQSDQGNPFENFVRSLQADQRRIDEIESRLSAVLMRLSTLKLSASERLIGRVMTRKQVDSLLEAAYRLRSLEQRARPTGSGSDVVVEIEKHQDGTLLVHPAHAS